jgi:hypothetical protein
MFFASTGLGRGSFKAETRIRIPVGTYLSFAELGVSAAHNKRALDEGLCGGLAQSTPVYFNVTGSAAFARSLSMVRRYVPAGQRPSGDRKYSGPCVM